MSYRSRVQFERQSNERPSIAIIGAGFSGICMGIKLQQAGIETFTIYEKGDDVGGVWRDNTYPGAACDIPSSLYSYSFEQRSDWSKKFPEQTEILSYLQGCARKFDLLERVRFGTEIVSAQYNDDLAEWTVATEHGEEFRHVFVIFACGQLNRPHVPDLSGTDSFPGPAFHSAQWNHEFSFSGKRVAVVGNGASAIQFVPIIARDAEEICVFQRSPNWIMRKRDYEIPQERKDFFSKHPFLLRVRRLATYVTFESRFLLMRKGSPAGWLFSRYLTRHLRRRVQSPKLLKELLPDFAVGCKRVLLSGDWFKTLQRPNVSLNASGAVKIEGDSVIAEDGTRFQADGIVFATGFQSTEFLAPVQVTGRDNLELNHTWRNGARAFLGMTVSGFPNLFILYGPNTNLGHNSVVMMIESQCRYILQVVELAKEKQFRSIDVRDSVMDRYDSYLEKQLSRTVWEGGCHNWYRTDSGRIVSNWPMPSWKYFWKTRKLRLSDYDIETFKG